MEHNLYDKYGKKCYQNHNQYSVPTSYSAGAHWTSDDLGNQAHFHAQFMARSDSLYSSHDSTLEIHSPSQPMYRDNSQSSNSTGYTNPISSPVDCSNNFSFEQNNNYPVPQPHSLGFPVGSYPHWATPRTGLVFEQLDSPCSPMSPTQSSGVQATQIPKYCCLMDNCNTSFARQADLQRHYDHKHTPIDQQKTWYCDWKTCPRSEQGSRDAMKRLSSSSSISTSASSHSKHHHQHKLTGVGPFTRKDHFKAHLREQHQEAIPKRDAKADPGWMDGKRLKEEWWRCGKCLKRVWIQTQRAAGRSEYTCCNCGTPCDQEVLEGRARTFAAAAASASSAATSGGSGSGAGAASSSGAARKSKR